MIFGEESVQKRQCEGEKTWFEAGELCGGGVPSRTGVELGVDELVQGA